MPKQKNTKPERIFRTLIMRAFRVGHVRFQQPVKGVGIPDFMVGKTILEVYGCYWHACPKCHSKPNERMKKQIAHDEKRSLNAHNLGYQVEVFWECEIYADPEGIVRRLKALA